MANLQIYDNYCQIEDETDLDFIAILDSELSFKVLGAEHTKAFKGYYRNGEYYRWDGIQRILKKNLSFPPGLMYRVQDLYKQYNKELNIKDNRSPKSESKPFDIIKKLKKLNKDPYPYQLDILKEVDKYDRGIIKVGTGGGKSLCIALITAHFGKPTIIYVIGKGLLYQFHEFFSSVFNEKIGIVGDGKCEIRNINIVSVWTVAQALGLDENILLDNEDDDEEELSENKYKDIIEMIETAKVHMIDECHISACKTIQEIFSHSTPEHLYGFSGSPWRDDGADLLIESVLGKYIVNISASYLIERGYLVQPIIKFIEVPKYPSTLEKSYPTVYKKYVVENEVRNQLIFEAAKALVEKGYQTLVLFSRLNHGKILYELIKDKIPCVLLNGNSENEERDQAVEDLKQGKIKCILASRIYDIGIDLPSLSGLVLASGGKSTVRALQRVGRVIRKFDSKKYAAVVDFIDNAHFLKEHSKIRYKVYKSEEGFIVKLPKSIKWK